MASPLTTAIGNAQDVLFPVGNNRQLKNSVGSAIYKNVFYNTKKTAADLTRFTVGTANDALKKALENVMSEAFANKHGKLAQSTAVANIEKQLSDIKQINDGLQTQMQRTKNRDWGVLSAFNPFLWRDAFADLTSESHTGLAGNLAKKLTGGLTSEQLYYQRVNETKFNDLQNAAAYAEKINNDADATDEQPGLLPRDSQTYGGLSLNHSNAPVDTVTTSDSLSVVDVKGNALLDQLVKFLTPNKNQTYNLEQQKEQEAFQKQQFSSLKQLNDNVKAITAVITNTPINKQKQNSDDQNVLAYALSAGGSSLISAIKSVVNPIVALAAPVIKLLSLWNGPILKAAQAIKEKLTTFLLSKTLTSLGDSLGKRKGSRVGEPLTTKQSTTNKKPANITTQPNESLTTKDAKSSAATPLKNEPLKPAKSAAVNDKMLTTGNKTVTSSTSLVKAPNTGTFNSFKDVSVKGAGKVLGAVGTVLELGSAAIDITQNNDAIDQQVAAGQLTIDQAGDLKVKQGTEIAAKSVIGAGAATVGGIGAAALLPALGIAASGPIGWLAALAGGAAMAAGADKLLDTDIGKAVTDSIGDIAVSIKDWWNSKDSDNVKAVNQTPTLTPEDASRTNQQPITAASQASTGSTIAETAFKQQQNRTANNIDASSRVNSVNNVTNNSEVVYNGMTATDNYGYSRILRDPRIVNYSDY